MGVSVSKRFKDSLANSPEFQSACDDTFFVSRNLLQHVFHGVFAFQLPFAAEFLYHNICSLPPIRDWVPSPPTQLQIDSALRVIVARHPDVQEEETVVLGPVEFKEWAVEVYGSAVAAGVGKMVIRAVKIGVGGIVGIGVLTRPRNLVTTAVGVCALVVAGSAV